MSTNPFRQSKTPQSSSVSFPQSESTFEDSDGGGLRYKDLSVDTKVPPSSLDRHVSFASPPVDSTISAVSYPSSPESARSPPVSYGQPLSPYTPDYRTALQGDPFKDLGQENGEDISIRQALQNAQSYVASEQNTAAVNQQETVRNTLSRFASGPRGRPLSTGNDVTGSQPPLRQSMDVDAFKRLLLTGKSGQNTAVKSSPPAIQPAVGGIGDSSYATDTASISQSSFHDSTVFDPEETSNAFNGHDSGTLHKQTPPPAPAPRRGKSVKVKAPSQPGAIDVEIKSTDRSDATQSSVKSKKPPTPPLARRQSHKTPNLRNDEASASSSENLDANTTPASKSQQQSKAPQPPPLRRQGASSEQRRVSHDLAPTVEEPETEMQSTSYISSRKSSDTHTPPMPPPPPPRSRSSFDTTKQRISVGPMNHPPVPPPRRGRGSSRSSIDSFRPSVASLMGDESAAANEQVQRSSQQERDIGVLTSSNANSILAELADLQREVDAARRGA